MKIHEPKYRILVVKDQSKFSQTALQDGVNLAKKIDGSIDILQVRSPLQVAGRENQLAAWRELQLAGGQAKNSLQEEVDFIAAKERIPATCSFAFGNIINEVQQHIKTTQPDIVVLGKQRSNLLTILGLDLTSYLLKNYQGALLISREKETLGSQDDIALGLLDDLLINEKNRLSEDLEKCTKKPITVLKISTVANEQKSETPVSGLEQKAVTTFEFDPGTNLSSNISKYIERSGVNLLCVSRSQLFNLNKKLRTVTREIQKTVHKTNTPVLVLAS